MFVAQVLLLTYIKTFADLVVFPRGWGGDVPQGQHNASTPCVSGIKYTWQRATAPDQERVTSCRPYVEVLTLAIAPLLSFGPRRGGIFQAAWTRGAHSLARRRPLPMRSPACWSLL